MTTSYPAVLCNALGIDKEICINACVYVGLFHGGSNEGALILLLPVCKKKVEYRNFLTILVTIDVRKTNDGSIFQLQSLPALLCNEINRNLVVLFVFRIL